MKKHLYTLKKIILFGSFAKRNFNSNSVIDIAVILDDFVSFTDIQMELFRLRRNIDSRIEPHPFRENDFNDSSPLAVEVIKYGILI